jgi:hypothetical protein
LVLELWQALPWKMEHLIDPELNELQQLLDKFPYLSDAFPHGIIDPCPKYCDVLEDTASWYFGARKSRHSESSILQTGQHGVRVQQKLKDMLPERAGTVLIMT